jgi:hypothetical protein
MTLQLQGEDLLMSDSEDEEGGNDDLVFDDFFCKDE